MHSEAKTPARTLEQRLAALKYANEIRTYRAQQKARIVSGEITVFDLVGDPLMDSAKVVEFLLCVPKIGKVKAYHLLRSAQMAPSKTFAGATDRQWDSLSRVLRGRPYTEGQVRHNQGSVAA